MNWIDSHCHLDAPEFDTDRVAVRAAARAAGVATCVIPAVEASNFDTVRALAHQHGDVYALGIHPMHTPQAAEADFIQQDGAGGPCFLYLEAMPTKELKPSKLGGYFVDAYGVGRVVGNSDQLD